MSTKMRRNTSLAAMAGTVALLSTACTPGEISMWISIIRFITGT